MIMSLSVITDTSAPNGAKGGKPSAQLGGTKQRMKVAPTGATPE